MRNRVVYAFTRQGYKEGTREEGRARWTSDDGRFCPPDSEKSRIWMCGHQSSTDQRLQMTSVTASVSANMFERLCVFW